MPALPVIANVYRVALNWTAGSGQDAVNVIHILDNTAAATDTTIRAALDAAADTLMWTAVVPSAAVTDIAITPLDGVHGTTHLAPGTPAKWTGQNGTIYAPAAAAMIKLSTGLRGRSKRGRVFLPFIDTTANVDGLLNATDAAAMTTAWADFRDDLAAGAPSLSMVVASYKLSTAAVVTEITCEFPLGTQRRRQGRLR